ncbi:hypothetical protein NEISUBOT_04184 [Neisseria subflava NJ9703]|uniref:Uncharacterized protein n=1 Tax=Neisseria subflava NJ9703 TaxID=546268 RepID=A0A9W5IRG3_NEISU|nr:hypothetical protein NEISUBOT_04184 [Neisseria subflava NJ9703]
MLTHDGSSFCRISSFLAAYPVFISFLKNNLQFVYTTLNYKYTVTY